MTARTLGKAIRTAALASAVAAAASMGGAAAAKDTIKVAIVTFLTGPAAGPFGVPGKNGAELMIDAINAGGLPGHSKGFGGATLDPVFADEAGGNSKQVAEYRNLVEKQNVDAVVGYISSGSCMATAPVAEELKKLTIVTICGTPSLFEDEPRSYVFRTQGSAVGDSIAAAHYVTQFMPDVTSYTGINQNYAFGQDSWKFFKQAMEQINPKAKASSNPQFPKIFSGQYGAEISTLSLDRAELVHSSFWDGDIEAFVLQALVRGFFDDKRFAAVVGDSAVDSLGAKFPDGVLIGTRSRSGILIRRDTTDPLNVWFIKAYKERYGAYPVGPSYQYAKAVHFLKLGLDKAAAAAGGFPTQAQMIEGLKGLSFNSVDGKTAMALGGGHQAIHDVGYGFTEFDKEKGEPAATNVKFYAAECINPPEGMLAEEWVDKGMPGAKCD